MSSTRDFVYEVAARDPDDDCVYEYRLCGHCLAIGRVMVINRKPLFTGAECERCGRSGPDMRPVLHPKCDCQPPAYEYTPGHRTTANGEQVPCILLVCAHAPCTAHMIIDFDWPRLGIPKFRHIHEGHT